MADAVPGLVLLALVALAVVVAVGASNAKRARIHREIVAAAARREEERAEAGAARDAAAFFGAVRDFFPFLPELRPEDSSPEAIQEAAADILASVPSLGEFGHPLLPAPALPPAERRRHLLILGKTGSGKTTFLEHLIARDLDEGRGVGVIAPEGELFRARLLPLVPPARRASLMYFAPGDPACPLTFNPLALEPGEDPGRAAEDLFTIFKRALADDALGPRMQPILQNAFAALLGRPGATFWDLRRLLEDAGFREEVGATTADRYVRSFWLETYPRYPKGSDLPILNRLDQFLRPEAIRRTLCRSQSSFSIRQALAEGMILFLDLFGLSEETRLLVGQMLLAKFQLELMRRELSGASPAPFHLYCDEFPAVAGESEGIWRDLLSRGRRYGLAITTVAQHPGQLPTGLQGEIFGNVNSIVSFALGAKDAAAVRKEFIGTRVKGKEVRHEPIAAEELIELPVGVAYAVLAGGRAVVLRFPPPLRVSAGRAEAVIRESWRRYAAKEEPPEKERPAPRVEEPESFLE